MSVGALLIIKHLSYPILAPRLSPPLFTAFWEDNCAPIALMIKEYQRLTIADVSRPHRSSSDSVNLGRRKPKEDADSISFWYKIAAFAQYNIPKIKKVA